jgi:pyridoxal phosphate enzyme, YggS family
MSYSSVLESVKNAADKAGRGGEVFLLPVSKLHDYSEIMTAWNEGARIFGENRVQEIEAKFPSPLLRPEGMKVYLIGHLQGNKVKKAVALVDRIESVDSLKLLIHIDKECAKIGKVMDLLFEVNSSGEEQKSGFASEEELAEAIKVAKTLQNIRLVGLMTVGPLGGDEEKNRQAFTYTRKLYEKYSEGRFSVLSMGMSGDYATAIECGSTECRIGSAVFGLRDYGKKGY